MGIPRWTQDLTPYLEAGVVTTTPDDESRLILRNVVIDGPSLVFHVYNALALSRQTTDTGSLNEPTYAQLNSAIDVFLTDLESCGAKIERIFFDGALPLSKRATRNDRLEKSRMQLERLKVLGLPPRPLYIPASNGKYQISTLLWQTKPGLSGISSFTSPFIVASVIEYLKHSNWNDIVFVVSGEAETSCASIARATGAAVLSNDSDLTLLADMQDGQSVGLLRSMNMENSRDGVTRIINIQCWRPKHIATRFGVPSILHVGFQRSKDPTISLATMLQRAQDERSKQSAASIDFDRFVDQFKACGEPETSIGRKINLKLDHLDPRLAELVCQLVEKTDCPTSQVDEFWVTLPVLLEDPSKDASWTYGRGMRRLAYSLLGSNVGTTTESTCAITEWSRKGSRIAQDVIEMIPPARLGHEIRGLIQGLDSLPRLTGSFRLLDDTVMRDYLLWALASALKQRVAAGKNVMPSITIREYVGLGNLDSTTKRARLPDHEAEWRLVHLNANVHSVLYSLRMLRQISALLHGGLKTTDYKYELVKLFEMLEFMPAIEDLFLNVEQVRSIMRKSPLSKADRAFNDICTYSGLALDTTLPRNAEIKPTSAPADFETVHKRKKKRRLATDKPGNQHKQPTPQKGPSTNPFDLLIERG